MIEELKQNKKNLMIWISSIIGGITLSFLLLGRSDALIFLKWASLMIILEMLMSPITCIIFDEYIPVGKIIGIIFPSFIVWIFGVIFHVPFTGITCLIIIISVYVIGSIIHKHEFKTIYIKTFNFKYEIVFFFMFLFWAYIIGFMPSSFGTEKFMDYGFMQSMISSTSLPPEDIWFAGENINYYYGGQFYGAFLAKLTHTNAEYAYNLFRALIPALMFTGVLGLVERMTSNFKCGKICSILSASVAVFAGNGHYIVYGLLKPMFQLGENNYWFPDSTRYIGYNPPVETDMTIHEFPCYSFMLGDLHAHMINILTVLLIITLLYSYFKTENKRHIKLIFIGIAWGICNWTNYWDYIIYFVVICITIIISNIFNNATKISLKAYLKKILFDILEFSFIGIISTIPFTLFFESVFNGVGIAKQHSQLYQLLILWGIPLVLSCAFLIVFLKEFFKDKKRNTEDIFCFILTCCAIGLVIIPEIVYVRDIYEATNPRANTMFKLTYQSFIMFSICSGYIIAKLINLKNKFLHVFAYTMAFIHILLFGYFFNAAEAWMPEYMNPSERQGLYSLTFLDTEEFKDEKKGILWLKNQVDAGKIKGTIIEAPGDSYTANERVSVITGIPTVAGWIVHEWLWRDSYEAISERVSDVDKIYNNPESTSSIVDKYDIDYIIFGKREMERYGADKKEAVEKLGEVIYKDDIFSVIKIRN